MFDVPLGRNRLCDGVTRRDFIRVGGLAMLGLSLPGLLAAEAQAEAARQGKSCLMLWMQGGPPHLETFDPKPEALTEIKGPWGAIDTNVPGIRFSEHMPKLAQQADKMCIVRTVNHPMSQHNSAGYQMMTGFRLRVDTTLIHAGVQDFPGFQAVAAQLKPGDPRLPDWVWLPEWTRDGPYHTPGQTGGFLGKANDPIHIHADPNSPNFNPPSLTPQPELQPRLARRQSLMELVDSFHRKTEVFAQTDAINRIYDKAFGLVTSGATKKAFAIQEEPANVREMYGRNKFGQSVLLGRRLIEAGVRCVTVTHGGSIGNWDTHKGHIPNAPARLALLDHVFATLIRDLDDRGLLDDTLVFWTGEFGRTPKINKDAGRDHWPQCFSVAMAGGGVKGGHIHGRSDAVGAYPDENPVTPPELHASVYEALGIPHTTMVHDGLNRPHSIVHGAQPVPGLLK